MGMFDCIKYQAKLPLSKKAEKLFSHINLAEEPFQTKDFENTMSKYIVNKQGNLYIQIVEGEHLDNPKPKGHKGFWFPYTFKETKRYNKKYNHNGDVYFYHILEDKKGNQYWLEFITTFIKGKVKNTKQVKLEIHQTAEEIKKNDQELKEMFEKHANHPYTKFKKFINKITFGGWDFFWRRIVFAGLYKLSNSISSFRMFLIRHI